MPKKKKHGHKEKHTPIDQLPKTLVEVRGERDDAKKAAKLRHAGKKISAMRASELADLLEQVCIILGIADNSGVLK